MIKFPIQAYLLTFMGEPTNLATTSLTVMTFETGGSCHLNIWQQNFIIEFKLSSLVLGTLQYWFIKSQSKIFIQKIAKMLMLIEKGEEKNIYERRVQEVRWRQSYWWFLNNDIFENCCKILLESIKIKTWFRTKK